MAEVNGFLERAAVTLDRLAAEHRELRDLAEGMIGSGRGRAGEVPAPAAEALTPADIRNAVFATTRFSPGYDEQEVDAFLDLICADLDYMLTENETLRARLTGG